VLCLSCDKLSVDRILSRYKDAPIQPVGIFHSFLRGTHWGHHGVMGARRPFWAYSNGHSTSSSLVYLRVSSKIKDAHFNCSSLCMKGARLVQLRHPTHPIFPPCRQRLATSPTSSHPGKRRHPW